MSRVSQFHKRERVGGWNQVDAKDFRALRINLASPETVLSWSYGEVFKPETINYRRLRPEKDGLFCEAIFGPTRDWQCYCGKYKNIRFKGITCEKCGVEVTRSSVRRERMGNIALAAPVAHVWYTRRVPSYLGLLLNVSRRNLDRVLYFAQYVVTYVDEESRRKALKRIEDDITRLDKEEKDAQKAQVAEVKAIRKAKMDDLREQKKNLKASYDEEVAAKIDPVIKEGQRLEKSLSEKLGKTIRAAIVFKATETQIAEKGGTIGNEHLALVQKSVKKRLDEIEAGMKEKTNLEIERIKMSIEEAKAEADLALNALRDEVDEDRQAAREQLVKDRDELLAIEQMMFLGETRFRELKTKWGQVFRADMGAEAFYEILQQLNLDELAQELWNEVRTTRSKQRRKKATKRLKVVEAFRRSANRPEWMILTVLPVIPPDLRPMVQLDGGRFATSDLNDLYRRVINRNNRLKRLVELGAPDVIVRNEKRMLQEAVDSLIDNSQRGKALSRRGRRELKSLSDMLKGKKGRFRRNLLGKRVDYSGRSVIVIGPHLKLYQCGLPKTMALELYRPFVISKLVSYNYAANVKGAKRIIERERPEVWEVLEEVIRDRPVLLNRAPTLHRLGIQAFEPVLVEGKAIQLHPLVCSAFNADFDGDQMSVHLPLSRKAVEEARELMLSTKNLLKPADGEPIVGPTKDMVLGVYYLTMEVDGKEHLGTGRAFSSIDEVEMAYNLGQVEVHSPIKLLAHTWYDDKGERLPEPEKRVIDTTIGRVLFNAVLPEKMRFVNRVLDKGAIQDLVGDIYQLLREDGTPAVVDAIKDIGFAYATRSGTTIAVSDITVPREKTKIINQTLEEADVVRQDYQRGLLTEQEMNERIIELWQETTSKVATAVREAMDPAGSLSTMAISGATKGGFQPISQLAGMRGLMADPAGRIIPLPIRSNFRDGLTTLEYFISTHGARKGLTDTALRTADAGYLTRRLVDVAQDVIINDEDCGTERGIYIRRADDIAGQGLVSRLMGRVITDRVVDPKTKKVLANPGDMIDLDKARLIDESSVAEVRVRSPLTCELQFGLCATCYGMDLGRGKQVELGAAVGIVAAQSIGEPGTQLTLRTFHTGGVAAGGDITTGLPRVEELFEARKKPKGEAEIAEIAGTVHIEGPEIPDGPRVLRITNSQMLKDEYAVPGNWALKVEDASEIDAGTIIAIRGDSKIEASHGGKVSLKKRKVIVSYEQKDEASYDIPPSARLLVKEGDKVEAGQQVTEGSLNPHRILRILGAEACQTYLLAEVQKVYRSQGQNINDKHFEVIIRKMLSKVQITQPGNTDLLPGDLVDRQYLKRLNEQMLQDGKTPARAISILLGITKASLSTESFLSASSFQHTIKVLAQAAIEGKMDYLRGLKENVIIGKLIPAGTGFPGKEAALHDERLDEEEIFAEPTAEPEAVAAD
ncbi:MAG TPA: DNA-directed RNA polymerase subunit beta' [Anaerolineae bacterium]|nr:DNA-directed RNA polymerase subunit beta' [Anaerolineae bacterium]